MSCATADVCGQAPDINADGPCAACRRLPQNQDWGYTPSNERNGFDTAGLSGGHVVPPEKSLTAKQERILELHAGGKGTRRIETELKTPRSYVRNVIALYAPTADAPLPQPSVPPSCDCHDCKIRNGKLSVGPIRADVLEEFVEAARQRHDGRTRVKIAEETNTRARRRVTAKVPRMVREAVTDARSIRALSRKQHDDAVAAFVAANTVTRLSPGCGLCKDHCSVHVGGGPVLKTIVRREQVHHANQ